MLQKKKGCEEIFGEREDVRELRPRLSLGVFRTEISVSAVIQPSSRIWSYEERQEHEKNWAALARIWDECMHHAATSERHPRLRQIRLP